MKHRFSATCVTLALLMGLFTGCASAPAQGSSSSQPQQSFSPGSEATSAPAPSQPSPESSSTPGSPSGPAPEVPAQSEAPVVYMTADISPEGMMAAYEALGWTPSGKVAVKLSTGEPPASNYLDPNLIRDVVQKVEGTIVECNTAYGGSRANTAMHYQVAKDHGFTDIANVVILDENGSVSLPVTGGLYDEFHPPQSPADPLQRRFGDYHPYGAHRFLLSLREFSGAAGAGILPEKVLF